MFVFLFVEGGPEQDVVTDGLVLDEGLIIDYVVGDIDGNSMLDEFQVLLAVWMRIQFAKQHNHF